MISVKSVILLVFAVAACHCYLALDESPVYIGTSEGVNIYKFCIKISGRPVSSLYDASFEISTDFQDSPITFMIDWDNNGHGIDITTTQTPSLFGKLFVPLVDQGIVVSQWEPVFVPKDQDTTFGDVEAASSLSGVIYTRHVIHNVGFILDCQNGFQEMAFVDDLCPACDYSYTVCGDCILPYIKFALSCEVPIIGCDEIVGSDLQLDSCGVCGGDNECETFSEEYYDYEEDDDDDNDADFEGDDDDDNDEAEEEGDDDDDVVEEDDDVEEDDQQVANPFLFTQAGDQDLPMWIVLTASIPVVVISMCMCCLFHHLGRKKNQTPYDEVEIVSFEDDEALAQQLQMEELRHAGMENAIPMTQYTAVPTSEPQYFAPQIYPSLQ